MMKVRKFIIPAAALAAACIFSACSGSGATETTAAATEAAAETSAVESSEAAETTAAEEGAEAESSEAGSSEGAQAMDTDSLELITAISKVAPVKPEVLGEVSLGEYTGLDLTAPKAAAVTDEEVDTYIETNILPSYPVEIVDGEVQEGDTATINFVGSIDGVEFPGGSGTDYPLVIGSGAFIPGFEDQLIGGHYGETINVNVTFPEDYGNEDLNCKDALFVCDINKIERPRTMAQIDDEFVEEITNGDYNTVDGLREFLKKGMQTMNDSEAKEGLADAILTKVLETSEVEPSQEAIDWQKDIYIRTYDNALSRAYGMSLASMIQMYGQTYDEFRDSLTEGATDAAKRAAVIYAIAEKEGLKVTDEAIAAYAEEFGYDNVEALTEATSESELELAVLSNLVTEFVAENSNVTYTEAAEETETGE